MTSRVVRNGPEHDFPGGLKEIVVSCDQIDCSTALTDTDIRDGGGLKNMGWQMLPADGQLHHYCPQHKR